MNKIVRRFYPIERLPDDLRSGLPRQGRVHIELEPDIGPTGARSVSMLVGSGRNVHGDDDAVLAYLRGLREDR
jgi:hypothetical protein